MKLWNFDTTQ